MITSSDPYVITNATTIETDPKITTNSVTDEGKIYRDPSRDGPFATWAFTATSTFDTNSGINVHFGSVGINFVAAFKFTNLQLDGDPVISIGGEGGTSNLALIGVNGLTESMTGFAASVGRTFTFAGIKVLLLATQAGSITLNDISFENIPQLYFYARGAGSNLTLGATITGTTNEILQAQHDVQVNAAQSATRFSVFAGNDYLAGAGPITAGTIDIRTGNNIEFTAAQYPYGESSGQTVELDAGNAVNIDTRNDLTVFDKAGFVHVKGNSINVIRDPMTEGGFFFSFEDTEVSFEAGLGGFNSPDGSYFHPGDRLNITSEGDILLGEAIGGSTLSADGSYTSRFGTSTKSLTAGATIGVGGDLFASVSVEAGSTITVDAHLSAPTVTAGGNITANRISVQDGTAKAGGAIIAQAGGIRPFLASDNPPGMQDTLTAASIQSAGGIYFNGSLFDQSAAGGTLTLISTGSQAFNISSTGNIQGAIDFNGADAPQGTLAGGGGTFIVKAAGAINVDNDIEASSGRIDPAEPASGNGGTVKLNSSGGAVTVNSRIEVSSKDPEEGLIAAAVSASPTPSRRSATGGNITLQSDRTTGTGIAVNQNAQLLSELGSDAAGPGGSITLSTMGADIMIAPGAVIRADRGTITMDQADPFALISIDGATLESEILNITGAGNVTFGATSPATVSATTISVFAPNDITFSGGDFFSNPVAAFFSNGNVNFEADRKLSFSNNVEIDRVSVRSTGVNITLDAGTDLTISGDVFLTSNVQSLTSGANVSVLSGTDTALTGDITIHGTLSAFVLDNISASGFATPTSQLGNVLVQADGAITVDFGLNVLGTVKATGAITAQTIYSTNVISDTSINAGSGGITPFTAFGTAPAILHTLSAPLITSAGGINFNGQDKVATEIGVFPPTDGGQLTINADTLSFEPANSGGALAASAAPSTIFGAVTLNGGAGGGLDPSENEIGGANGGTLTVNTTGDLIVNNDIEATTGLVPQSFAPSGAGGTVNLNSTNGAVVVSSRIEVSSNSTPSGSPAPPSRRSKSGGNINIKSGRSGADAQHRVTAIDIKNSSQLLSLLAAAPSPGPGGQIVILATGADSDVNVKGKVRADRGLVDIRHSGVRGEVYLGGAVADSLDIHGDVVKVGVFDKNGVLEIGQGTISADSVLKLYAPGDNGEVRFIANVSLTGSGTKIIAGQIVTIVNGVVVNITGGPSQVFTNVPNYSTDYGGNGSTTGTFSGSAAPGPTPQPLNSAPPFDPLTGN